jgi:hypothetical protein
LQPAQFGVLRRQCVQRIGDPILFGQRGQRNFNTDLAAAIQMAKANGMTTREIVRELTRVMSHSYALRLARRAAPLLDIGVSEFRQLRKNE